YGPEYAEFDLPIIDGLASDPKDGGPLIEAGRAELVARLLGALEAKPELARRISQIDVQNPRDAVVLLDHDPALLRLGSEQFLERLEAYLEIAPVLRQSVAHIDYVDLRFGDRVYVGSAEVRTQMRRSTKAVAAAAR
ncbi:MAG: cell division protein FtsQ, partial [Acidobacteria bacterium]|nr:cell division protein FtsQ [Acidobacteriota bacterium]